MESGSCLLCLVLFICSSFKGEREGSVCSFSILYRISLFPFPFVVVCVFTFFFREKNLSDLCFVLPCVASLHMPSFSFASSPLDSLIASANKPPARSYSPMDIVSHRTILQYVSLFLKETDKPLYSNCHSAVYVFRESGCSKVPGVRYSILIIHPSLVHYDPACR